MSAATLPITRLDSGADASTYCWTTSATRSSLGRSMLRDVGARQARVARVAHDHVVRAGRHQLTRAIVDREGDVGQDPPERASARDQARRAVCRRDRAVVLGVGVARHDHLDRRVETLGDAGDVGAREVPGTAVERRRTGLEPALVDHEDARVDTPAAQLLDGEVGGIGLVLEREPGNARRRHDGRRLLEHLADHADAELLRPLSPRNLLMPNAGNSVRPVSSTTTLADRYWKSAPG